MVRAKLEPTRRGALGMVVAAALVVSTGGDVRAQLSDAESVVQDLARQVWALLERPDLDQRGRLDELTGVLESRTDVDLLSRLVLGRYWRLMSEEQRTGYQELFRAVVMRDLAMRLDRYASDASGSIDDHFQIVGGGRVGDDDVLVRSRVIPEAGKPVTVDWRLRQRPDGPVIIDLVIEGVSLLVSQRSEFASVIERSNMDGFLAELRARAQSSKS
jgi:phospholipid transport system substrate-binding protein